MANTALFFQIFNLSRQSLLLDNLMIFTTNYLIFLMLLFIFFLGLKGNIKEKKAFLLIILGIPLAFLLIQIIHLFINEPRPFVTFHLAPLVNETTNASFPSRHATIVSVIAFAYTHFRSKWSTLLLTLMVLVGISRIYVGVHYPLDVLGGFILGAISIHLVLQLKNILKLRFFRESLQR